MKKSRISLGLLAFAGGAFADSISPLTYEATLAAVGESITITKTVVITDAPPTTAKVDVLFLADETGSMGGVINAVKASASSILSSVGALGDVQFAVAGYRDIPGGYTSTSGYRLIQDFTGTTSAVQTAINAYSASGGADIPEANLHGLTRAANEASWRGDATKIIVWFGDAPGHSPSLGGETLASTIAALNAENIKVQAVNVGNLNGTGQATAIATATGGAYYSGINSGSIASTITSSITTSFDTYSTVSLAVDGLGAGVGVSFSPASHTGSFDRSTDRTFTFDVTFTGLAAGADETFNIHALVDGGIVATETDHIMVADSMEAVPEPGTMALMGLGLFALAGLARRRRA